VTLASACRYAEIEAGAAELVDEVVADETATPEDTDLWFFHAAALDPFLSVRMRHAIVAATIGEVKRRWPFVSGATAL
jgi:hypothetical protein